MKLERERALQLTIYACSIQCVEKGMQRAAGNKVQQRFVAETGEPSNDEEGSRILQKMLLN